MLKDLTIAFATGREITYPRNASLLRAMAQFATVQTLSSQYASLTRKLIQVSGNLLVTSNRYWNVCFAGFYGQPLVLAARLRWRGPLILDAFVSTYDTYCFDRQIFQPRSIPGRIAFHLDRISCQMADVVIVDTQAQAAYFQHTFGVPSSKIRVLYVGCDDELFAPKTVPLPNVPTVLFYGTFLPLHGVDIILRSAHQMLQDHVRFLVLGRGQEYERARNLAEELELSNVSFLDPVPLAQLPDIISRASICLGGHFGPSDKARRVIAGKTFQCLAAGKPTIIGDNPANAELFTHGRDAWMCEMNSPAALTKAIRHLLASPELCLNLGQQARRTIQQTCGSEKTAQRVRAIIEQAVSGG